MKLAFTFLPHPVHSYAEALTRIECMRAREPPAMNPLGRLQFMTHGQQVQRVIVFVHGYTNCPQQFHLLGQRFHALGYNVLCAPLPHHGLADRMTPEHARLTAVELVQYTHEVVDIAQGLGCKVDIAGISAGGILAAYAAQTRNDLHLAVLLAPAFGISYIPAQLTGLAARLLLALPNFFIWWDQALKNEDGVAHAYPRFSTYALAHTLLLGQFVLATAQRQAPTAKILLVTSAYDRAVNRKLTATILENWRRNGARLVTHEFPFDLKIDHDFIEPTNPQTRIGLIYPRLMELMTRLR